MTSCFVLSSCCRLYSLLQLSGLNQPESWYKWSNWCRRAGIARRLRPLQSDLQKLHDTLSKIVPWVVAAKAALWLRMPLPKSTDILARADVSDTWSLCKQECWACDNALVSIHAMSPRRSLTRLCMWQALAAVLINLWSIRRNSWLSLPCKVCSIAYNIVLDLNKRLKRTLVPLEVSHMGSRQYCQRAQGQSLLDHENASCCIINRPTIICFAVDSKMQYVDD